MENIEIALETLRLVNTEKSKRLDEFKERLTYLDYGLNKVSNY